MKIEILNEKENPLLKRKEFEVKVTHDTATPSISEIRKKIATSKSIDKGTIIIDSFKSKYGSRETLGTVKVYQTKERALEIEPRHRLIKNGLIEITEEKPVETKPEKKEEAKPTEKAETEAEKKPKDEEKPEKKEEAKKAAKPVKEERTAEKEAEAKPEEKKKGKEKPKDKKKGE